MEKEYSYPKNKIKILLLEKINPAAKQRLSDSGYSVYEIPRALTEEELLKEIEQVHILGIRSKTRITKQHFNAAKRLLAIGCFGVGTNQVDLINAALKGVPVFNAPFSSTRSVAELALGLMLMLARRLGDANTNLHQGRWEKSSVGMHEVRGKVLGLIGYGHIGQQVGLLAEHCGLQVRYFDPQKKLPLGNAIAALSLESLVAEADFISLHVPAFPKGKYLIGAEQLKHFKKGSYLINTSRGSLIDVRALQEALESKQLAGAGLDVYPDEPGSNSAEFNFELAQLPNVVLSPHIGGSTEEAQRNIALEVAESFIKFIDCGSSIGAVNFPQADLPINKESHRILFVHHNIPGVLSEINKIVSQVGANIDAQYLATYREIGYLIMDLNKELSEEVKSQIAALPSSIRTRILF